MPAYHLNVTIILIFFIPDVSETLGAHILEMPYKGGNISMYILLPPFSNTENSIETTLKHLTLENFRSIVENDNLASRTVQLALPKFTMETTIEMTPVSIIWFYVVTNSVESIMVREVTDCSF